MDLSNSVSKTVVKELGKNNNTQKPIIRNKNENTLTALKAFMQMCGNVVTLAFKMLYRFVY